MKSVSRTIRAKLLLAMGALALVALVLAGMGIRNVSKMNDSLDTLGNISAMRIYYATHAALQFQDFIRAQKNHIIEQKPDGKLKWEEQQRENERAMFDDLSAWDKIASEKGKELLTDIRQKWPVYAQLNSRLLEQSRKGDYEAVRQTSGESVRVGTEILKDFDSGVVLARTAIAAAIENGNSFYAGTRNLMLIVSIVGIVLCFSVAFYVIKKVVQSIGLVVERIRDVAQGEGDLTKRIEVQNDDELGELSKWFNTFMDKLQEIIIQVAQSTEHIASATEEISSSATQSSQSAETQKDQTNQVATAMQEMSSTVLQVSENSNKAAESARQAGEIAKGGGKIVSQTVEVIQGLATSTRDTATKIQELGKSSDQIGQIIGVIDDIADQTNLLALNAAIEAARAGEQGRGFAVVADEVRKLAERTTQATKEIAKMIKTIQEETQRAVEAMESGTKNVEDGVSSATKAGEALQDIIHASEQVGEMIVHIATAATEQSSATEQVNSNMEQIAKLVQESAIGAQQSAKACADLSNLALDMQALVGRFKLGDEHHDRRARRTGKSATPRVHPEVATSRTFTPEHVGMVQ